MAFTEFGSADAQAVKRWCDKAFRETLGKMGIRSLIGRGDDASIKLLTELDKDPGDEIRYDLLVQDRSAGVNGDSRLKGYETALTYYQDTLKINQKRHAHSFKGMTQQRTVHDLREAGRFSLTEWYAWLLEGAIFAHLAGVAGTGEESVVSALGADTGGTDFAGNTITALDSDHLVDGTGNDFELSLLDSAIAKAKVNNPRVKPLMINGQPKYVAYLHPYSVKAMKIATVSAGSNWLTIQQNAGARGNTNPIYSGALGEYNGVIIRESEFIPRSGTNVSHNLLLGAGAGTIAFGNAWKRSRRGNTGGSPFYFKEEMDDYDNEEGIAAASIFGVKRCQFNSKAFGVIGINTTEAAPS